MFSGDTPKFCQVSQKQTFGICVAGFFGSQILDHVTNSIKAMEEYLCKQIKIFAFHEVKYCMLYCVIACNYSFIVF